MVDMSGKAWSWRADTKVGRELSLAALREFQRAVEIREAFFPGGGSAPDVQVTIEPIGLSPDADLAVLNVSGTPIAAQQVGNQAVTFPWPAAGGGSLRIDMSPALPGRDATLSIQGPWGLMRLLDGGAVTRSGDQLIARVAVSGPRGLLSDQRRHGRQSLLPARIAGFLLPNGVLTPPMPVGLYGKMPSHRDFLATGIPGSVLHPFETWLHAGVGASRIALGSRWEELFLVTRSGGSSSGSVCSARPLTGALMPSVDSVGRYFPLVLAGLPPKGSAFLPSAVRSDAWYRALDERLLLALAEDFTGGPDAVLAGLPEPDLVPAAQPQDGPILAGPVRHGLAAAAGEDAEAATGAVLEALRPLDLADAAAGRCYLWTAGGASFGARAFSSSGVPDPDVFVSLMSGRFD